jgi:hypothetical protein
MMITQAWIALWNEGYTHFLLTVLTAAFAVIQTTLRLRPLVRKLRRDAAARRRWRSLGTIIMIVLTLGPGGYILNCLLKK